MAAEQRAGPPRRPPVRSWGAPQGGGGAGPSRGRGKASASASASVYASVYVLAFAFVWLGWSPALAVGPAAEEFGNCSIAESIDLFECKHGGTMYSTRNTSRLSCSHCICPEDGAWGGLDCSLCTSVGSCPDKVSRDGKRTEALACTRDTIQPTREELEQDRGKIMSCSCGGDPQSEQYCAMQPNTYALIRMMTSEPKSNHTGGSDQEEDNNNKNASLPSFHLDIKQLAGAPDMPGVERYRFAYPVVWNGTFSNCRHESGECYGPLKSKSCDIIRCDMGAVNCPPPDVVKCPEWDPVGDCGLMPNSTSRYWQFHCIPLSVPVNSSAVLYCEKGGNSSESHCYFYQEDSLFGQGISMQCQTGNCVYEHPAPGPAPPDPSHDPDEYKVPALVATNLMFALVLGVFIASAGLFVHKETEKWKMGDYDPNQAFAGGDDTTADDVFSLVSASVEDQDKKLLTGSVILQWTIAKYEITTPKCSKQILHNVYGVAASSSAGLFAILGPSGAGKTTLLDILAGRHTVGTVSGDIRVNGQPVNPAVMTQIAGYAPQSDILPGTSTVWEYLVFHANLRLPAEYSPAEKKARVRSIVSQLGLKKITESFIGDDYTRGISGGEKKCVSVASELLHRPCLMFLDEPTTGLDSTNAATMVELLSSLAEQGVIVVLSIHQPRSDIFALMERVLVLSSNGEMVYSGPTVELVSFLSSLPYVPSVPQQMNVADFMLDLVIKREMEVVSSIARDFETQFPMSTMLESVSRQSPGANGWGEINVKHTAAFTTQLQSLSVRFLRNMYRHPFLVFLNLVCTLGFSILVGVSYWKVESDTSGIQNRMGCLFFILLYLALMSLSSIPIWRDQHVLFLRESAAQAYGSSAYFISVILFDILPMRVFPPCFFGFFTYWMVGLHRDCRFCLTYFLMILIVANIASALLSMAIGAASPSNRVANYVGSLTILVLSLFGSFLMNKGNLPSACQWIAAVSFLQYGYEALVVNEFHQSKTLFTLKVPIESLPPLSVNGDGVLKQFGFNVGAKSYDLLMLMMLALAHGLLGYIFLSLSGRHILDRMLNKLYSLKPRWMYQRSIGMPTYETLSPGDDQLYEENVDQEHNSPSPVRSHRTQSYTESIDGDPGGDLTSPLTTTIDPDNVQFQMGTPEGYCLTWHMVSKCVMVGPAVNRKPTQILYNVSGIAGFSNRTSDVAASSSAGLFVVLGPSGAGKTTLLDILAGRHTVGTVSGDIRVNGQPVNPAVMTQIAGYAPQSDILPGTSTVWEYLVFHANLRLPAEYSPAEKKARVRSIVSQLGLKKITESFIGDDYTRGISGGEKKRVSVASELLHRPCLMFLDEPTTGLDSTNAATMVELLSSLAAQGITIILSIQQPRSDIFALMERVLVLSSNGEMVYSGPVVDLDHFLSNTPNLPEKGASDNTADYILDVIIKGGDSVVEELIRAFEDSDVVKKELDLLRQVYRNYGSDDEDGPGDTHHLLKRRKFTVSYGTQVSWLSKRHLKNTVRQPFLVYLNFISTAVISVMLGLVFYHTNVNFGGIQNRMGSMFFIVLYLGLASLSSVPVWNEHKLLFLRERASGAYGTMAHFTSVVLFDIVPMRIIPTCMFSVSFFMIGLSSTTDAILHFPVFVLILVLANAAAVSMSMCIGACFPDTKIANAFASLAVLLTIMYSGFILSRHTMGAFSKVMSNLSYMSFAFEALLINEFHGAQGYYFDSYADKALRVNVTGDEVLALFDYNANYLLWDMAALAMMSCICFGLCFAIIHFKS